MTTITRSELLALARVSNIDLTPAELDSMTMRLEEVLSYAACITELQEDASEQQTKNINVFRPDNAIAADPEILLAAAPEREENYFVVPIILESNTESKQGQCNE